MTRVAAGAAALVGFGCVTVFALSAAGPPGLDVSVFTDVVAERIRPVSVLARAVSDIGSTVGLVVALIIVVGILRVRTGRWMPGVQLTATLAVSMSMTTLVKVATARPRPPAPQVLGVPAASYAFPSGHTLNSTVFFLLTAALLSPYLPAARKAALWLGVTALVLLIGWSRVYLGYHWPTDVLAGWLLGVGVVCTSMCVSQGWSVPDRELLGAPQRSLTKGSAGA